MTAWLADASREYTSVDDLKRDQQQQKDREENRERQQSGDWRTYNLGAVRPFVKKAAEEIGNKFGITTIGGWRASARDKGGHPAGLAIDVMCSGSTLDAVRQYAVSHRSRLGVKYVLAKQREYSQEAGWTDGTAMEDRGDPTQNHMDHAHIQFKLMGGTGAGGDLIDGGSRPPGAEGAGLGGLVPDWMGAADELLLKALGVGASAVLVVVGIRQAVTKGD